MDYATQRSSESESESAEPSCAGGSSPAPVAAAKWAFLLQEATGDSECDDGLASAAFDADDGDAESCSGGEDCSTEPDGGGRRLVSWECWMMESASAVVVVGGEAACPASAEEDTAAGDADSDKLFWEACIAHGY